jgi:hypothetical protein
MGGEWAWTSNPLAIHHLADRDDPPENGTPRYRAVTSLGPVRRCREWTRCSCSWAEGDGVAEVLKSFEQVVAAAVGVGVAVEVVAAQVAVVLVT